jgi:riboflavin synthase
MYTGITKGLFEVIRLRQDPGLISYTVQLSPELCANLKPGDSVAVDGVCQTVVNIENTLVSFQARQMHASLASYRLLLLLSSLIHSLVCLPYTYTQG